ncbi:hypothetical protein GCM10007937_42190 [Mesorhizobium albiziae]|nr:hypothetical protein GCM10007937_42190 [Mesorhizobium albiziae]
MTPRRFQRWTESDLDQLRVLARRHIRVPAIARILGRTISSVRTKASAEGIRLIEA